MNLKMLRLLVAAMALGACLPVTATAQSVNADFNGDGVPDVATFSSASRSVIVRIGPRHAVLPLHASEAVVAMATADIDRDGTLDIVVRLSRSGLRLWRNVHSGTFVKIRHRRLHVPPLLVAGHRRMATGDPDSDHAATDASPAPLLKGSSIYLVHDALARGAIPERAGTRPLQTPARTQSPRAPPTAV